VYLLDDDELAGGVPGERVDHGVEGVHHARALPHTHLQEVRARRDKRDRVPEHAAQDAIWCWCVLHTWMLLLDPT
jgi:hypothetical protein